MMTLWTAAGYQTDPIKNWWSTASVTELGVLPFQVIDDSGELLPLAHDAEQGINARFETKSGKDVIRFAVGKLVTSSLATISHPTHIKVGERWLPVFAPTARPDLSKMPQVVQTLRGISSAYHSVPFGTEVVPHLIRNELHLVVPPETLEALKVLEPIEVRKGRNGRVAFLFTFKETRYAMTTWRTREGGAIIPEFTFSVVLPAGHAHSEQELMHEHPDKWPLLVSSLEEL